MRCSAQTCDWTPEPFGLAGSNTSLVIQAPAIAGGVLTAGGSSSIAAVAWGAAAVPVIGAVVAGVTLALLAIYSRKGPKQKVATTHIVDDVEPELQKNVDGYLAGPRTESSQAQALANFEAGWQYVVDNCSDASMGEPGKRCVSERQPGGRWDWFRLYRDPIANDPNVQPDPTIVDTFFPGGGSGGSTELLIAALFLAGAAMLLQGGRS